MIFHKLDLSEDGVIYAHAEGHATEVIKAFHDVCHILLTSKGPWRMTEITGKCSPDMTLDSEMTWILEAQTKR